MKARQQRCVVASALVLCGSERGTGESESEHKTALPSALPNHDMGLAPAYGSHAVAMAYGQSAMTPADSELHWVTDSVTSCTCNS